MLHHWWGYIFLFHLVFVLEPETNFAQVEHQKKCCFVFFIFLDSWKRFCVVRRNKGRIKEPGIKTDSKGEEVWGEKRQWRRKLEISAAGFG